MEVQGMGAEDRSGTNAMNQDQDDNNMVRVFGQLFMLPIAALAYGMDMVIKTMQEMQRVTNRGMQVVAGPGSRFNDGNAAAEPEAGVTQTYSTANGTQNEEEKLLSYDNNGSGLDKNLRDDMLKLVRYKILFVKREYEHAFPEQEDLVYDNLDGNAFTAWKVAEFIQDLARVNNETSDEGRARVGVRLPHKWRDKKYAEDYWKDGYLTGLPHEDKKYLRVFFQVLERYPREKFRHDERQIEVLEEIRDRMPPAKSASGQDD